MITRAHMRRQLYRSGGITNARQGYGIGSWVKERVRKLIPNELADVAAKAAPFVAPFNPLAAGLMRGVGRFDKRGSISDALKQGLLTYGGGQLARGIGGAGMQTGFNPMGGMDKMKYGLSNPMGAWGGPKTASTIADKPAMLGDKGFKMASDQSFLDKVLYGREGGTGKIFGDKGLLGAGGDFSMKGAFGKGIPAVMAGSTIATMAVQAAMGDLGEREAGESLDAFNTRRKGTVGKYLDFYFRRANKFRIAPEDMDKAAADFEAQNTKEYVASGQLSEGGRVGYMIGGEAKQMEAGAPPIIYEGNMDPNQQAGLPSIPGPVQMAEDGPEYDMSERGGFQPLGAQEGKDDVKANLAKNEFVFTADAVRAAGGGSIEKGAQKMYDTMKKLESRVA